MKNPTVSVFIPSYNHEKYVEEAIESVLNQTYQDFEIIITDDGSSDNTVEVIKKFSDPRIKLFVFEENKGACTAANNCIINSKGKYIAYISSDDVWEPSKLETQVKFLDENPQIAAVFSKPKLIDENGNLFSKSHRYLNSVFDKENRSNAEWLNYFFYQGNCICHPTILIRKSVYDEVGLYNESMANIPDFEMWVRICLKYNIHILDENLIRFRVRDNEANASGDKPETHIRGKFEYKQTFNHFLKIDDIEFFLKIFPDAPKYGEPRKELIPYFLGRIAYESNIDVKQLWGLETIYKIMQSPEIVDILDKDYNFQHSEFLKMSAQADIYKIQEILEKDGIILQKDDTISNLESLIYEMEYLNNKGRSITQRLISKFPSLYILLKATSTGIKKALINIKGYKSIKKHHLMDIGYYLKNNGTVRLSGVDPILHYIYHGFKEGRRPNPQFDGNYYLETHEDVKNSNLNPLVHYSLYGITEKRRTQRTNLVLIGIFNKMN